MQDIEEALAFYRDALGLEVEAPEEVADPACAARSVPVGGPALELLEATAPDSAIATYIEQAGTRPPPHDAARGGPSRRARRSSRLAACGSSTPSRGPGAEGALVAFIHPSAAHGVLVELKQRADSDVRLDVKRLAFGDLQLTDAARRPVPARWRRDVRRRAAAAVGEAGAARRAAIAFSWRCGRCSSRRRGAGCSSTAAPATRWREAGGHLRARSRRVHLDQALADAGLTPASIDFALATHLHFDHFGGATVRVADGVCVRGFRSARYLIRAAEWEDATHPHERNRASYLQEDFVPLKDAGVVRFLRG